MIILYFRFLLILSAFFIVNSSNATELKCLFSDEVLSGRYGYSCWILFYDFTELYQTSSFQITGNHKSNRTNEDVVNIKITNSKIPFIIKELFVAFPNALAFEMNDAGLKVIKSDDFKNAGNVELVYLTNNNIDSIPANGFTGLKNMNEMLLLSSHVSRIHEDAFVGCYSMITLWLFSNPIKILHPNLFNSMTELKALHVIQSGIERLDGRLFRNNLELQSITFQDNNISSIESNLFNNLDKVNLINFFRNPCVDRIFIMNEVINIDVVKAGLSKCFDNFEPKTTRITMEFTGPLKLYDEKGNLIFSN